MMRTILMMMLILAVGACSGVTHLKDNQPRAVKGEIDLSQWDFEKNGPAWLKGEWYFFPGLIKPEDFKPEMLLGARFGKVPGKRPDFAEEGLTSFGVGTWILKMKVNSSRPNLNFREIGSLAGVRSYAVNLQSEKMILQLTEFYQQYFTTSEWVPQKKDSISELPRNISEIYILRELTNNKRIAIDTTIVGTRNQIQNTLIYDWMERSFLMGCYFVLSIACFAYFIQRRSDLLYLYTSGICAAMLLRYLGTEGIMTRLGPDSIHPRNLLLLNYILIQLGTCLASIFLLATLNSLANSRAIKLAIRILMTTFGVMLLIATIAHANFNNFAIFIEHYALYFMLFGTLSSLGTIVVTMLIVNKLRGWSLYLGGGIFCQFAGLMWDFRVNYLSADLPYVMHYCNLVLCLGLTLMIGKRFALTYSENERLLTEIQDKEKARTLFFHNTSHELRTPLNGIIGFMQLLMQGRYGTLGSSAQEQIGKCLRLALSLKSQVNTILDLAKSKKGQMALTNSLIALDEIATEIDDLAAGLRLRKSDTEFSFVKFWNKNNQTFICDREKIGMLLRNLLGNAFKFTDPTRPNHVSLTIERLPAGIHIEVKDSGIGIPEDQHAKVFEEFQQVAGDARRAYEGTGLGLAMVRDIIRLMGGTIKLESKPGVGSRFIIDLPEQRDIHLKQQSGTSIFAESSPIPSAKAGDSVTNSAPKGKGSHILVVDDHELNCELLRDILQEEGYSVSIALGGEEALKAMKNHHPDLVLLDMMMPYVSGEDVIHAMQKDGMLNDVPVILITARASEDDRLFGLSLGADDYLAKPIHHEELLFRVRNILHRVETVHHVTVIEERERLAQLGSLMQEMSHELKNVFQLDQQNERETQISALQILTRLPIEAKTWTQAVQSIASDEKLNAQDIDLSVYSFVHKSSQSNRALRYLRAIISQVPLAQADKCSLWDHIQSLNPQTWEECERSIHFVKNHVLMQNQTQYASDLIINILEYSRHAIYDQSCELTLTLPRVLKLLQPKITRFKIQLDIRLEPIILAINSGHFMQVCLNLLGNACDAVADLDKSERWIKISIHTQDDLYLIRFTNGGPPILPERASRLFLDAESSKGSKGYGLGLGISQRILMRSHGRMEYDLSSESPTFVVHIAKSLEVGHDKKTA